MSLRQRTWAVVLAAGDGTRLASLTRDTLGNAVPKQYCSLNGGEPLIGESIQRARRVVPQERVCVVVSATHRRFWHPLCRTLPAGNVIVQPANRGTAHGILLAVLRVLERDPLAQIIFLPADHYVRDENALAASLRAAAELVTQSSGHIALVGIRPEAVDPELGYILPGSTQPGGAYCVDRFVEKPEARLARELIVAGALWNSFIFAACATTLLSLMRKRLGDVVEDMTTALARDTLSGNDSHALADLYEGLPSVDFSRAVMQDAETHLRLVAARACGWSDLGTPTRVADALKQIRRERLEPSRHSRIRTPVVTPGFINLAAQQARLEMVG